MSNLNNTEDKISKQQVGMVVCGGFVFIAFMIGLTYFGVLGGMHRFIIAAIAGLLSVIGLSLVVSPNTIRGKEIKGGAGLSDKEMSEIVFSTEQKLHEIEKLKSTINSLTIEIKMKEFIENSYKILEFVAQDPEKLKKARRFIDHYIPTTLSILVKYKNLGIGSGTTSVTSSSEVVKNINKAIHLLTEASQKQLENMTKDDLFDLEADAKVLEMSLNSDGLSNERDMLQI